MSFIGGSFFCKKGGWIKDLVKVNKILINAGLFCVDVLECG